ncbi:glutamate ligase domain-containing protein [Streptomyces luteireticuli]|uniref:Peptidase C39 domain-containing protein n=1 Tax=Streptomyces luteireticuli TaxID=173858 RepID=A0ABN0Z6X8_9ACTN
MSRVHDVPMCRQRVEPDEWELHNGDTLGDRAEWSDRACGMAALRMILLAYGQEAPSVTELLKLGVEKGILVERGWVHAGIADLAAALGVPGCAEPVPVEELVERLNDAPLIMSVAEQFPDDGRRGGHLVVARGFEDGPDPAILIRDPSGWGQTHDRAPLSRVAASYSGRAITFPPLAPGGRRIAVLGEMAELGDVAVESHREVGRMAAEYGVDMVVAVGDVLAKQLALAAKAAGVPEVVVVRDNETATTFVDSLLKPGDVVLTKASRSGMLWQVAQALTGQPITGF